MVRQHQMTSINDLLDILDMDGVNESKIWFRGHALYEWSLLPLIARQNSIPSERDLFNIFRQNASYLLDKLPSDFYHWATIMQHHGIPTRLLDWTENPLVALYFAVSDRSFLDKNGVLWILHPCRLNKISNISNDNNYIPSIDDSELANYTLDGLISPVSDLKPLAFIYPRTDPRMHAQSSVFTIFHKSPFDIRNEKLANKNVAIPVKIPHRAKLKLMADLEKLNINRFSLFPELSTISTVCLKRG